MSLIRIEPIAARTVEIVETVMAAKEIVALPELEFSFRLVVEELVSNVVNYSTSETITIAVERIDNVLRITISDKGIPFNPLEHSAPDVTLEAEDRPIGGLGIFLVREIMNRVTYAYENQTNILTMEKDIK